MDEVIYESLCKYYNTLKNLGYVNLGLTTSLVIACALNELIEDFSDNIGEKELAIINDIMKCIDNSSCLVDYESKDLKIDKYSDKTANVFEYIFPLKF